ncbi:hypothetical protein ACF09K_31835 [Streptomyces sp. NPDC014882]|uniref:hypothetical protein n=1 Tax=Streptomyces sp. NPDC014882 TaxID=3364927 RepID=UPI0037024924
MEHSVTGRRDAAVRPAADRHLGTARTPRTSRTSSDEERRPGLSRIRPGRGGAHRDGTPAAYGAGPRDRPRALDG